MGLLDRLARSLRVFQHHDRSAMRSQELLRAIELRIADIEALSRELIESAPHDRPIAAVHLTMFVSRTQVDTDLHVSEPAAIYPRPFAITVSPHR